MKSGKAALAAIFLFLPSGMAGCMEKSDAPFVVPVASVGDEVSYSLEGQSTPSLAYTVREPIRAPGPTGTTWTLTVLASPGETFAGEIYDESYAVVGRAVGLSNPDYDTYIFNFRAHLYEVPIVPSQVWGREIRDSDRWNTESPWGTIRNYANVSHGHLLISSNGYASGRTVEYRWTDSAPFPTFIEMRSTTYPDTLLRYVRSHWDAGSAPLPPPKPTLVWSPPVEPQPWDRLPQDGTGAGPSYKLADAVRWASENSELGDYLDAHQAAFLVYAEYEMFDETTVLRVDDLQIQTGKARAHEWELVFADPSTDAYRAFATRRDLPNGSEYQGTYRHPPHEGRFAVNHTPERSRLPERAVQLSDLEPVWNAFFPGEEIKRIEWTIFDVNERSAQHGLAPKRDHGLWYIVAGGEFTSVYDVGSRLATSLHHGPSTMLYASGVDGLVARYEYNAEAQD